MVRHLPYAQPQDVLDTARDIQSPPLVGMIGSETRKTAFRIMPKRAEMRA